MISLKHITQLSIEDLKPLRRRRSKSLGQMSSIGLGMKKAYTGSIARLGKTYIRNSIAMGRVSASLSCNVLSRSGGTPEHK